MRRLAFVQMFFHQSVDQTRRPEPLGVTGILGLHDSAESFLQVAAEQLGVALPPFVPFLDYFKLIRNGAGVKLSRQREMEDLNSLRVNFKHRGTLPGATATADAREDVRRFLEENTPLVFGIGFADIDMAEVIPQQLIADKVPGGPTPLSALATWSRLWACSPRPTRPSSIRPVLAAGTRSADSVTVSGR